MSPVPAGTKEEKVPAPAEFSFDRFHLLKLRFEELPLQSAPSQKASQYGVNIEVGLSVATAAPDGKAAEVQMHVKVRTDPSSKPYAVELTVAGYFSLKRGTVNELQLFCQQLAPAILFPYVRQIVDRTTADGRFGNVLLDPMNITAAMDQSKWTESETEVPSSAPK